uniref:Putative secreted protein n=1 Tax=Panstrongylus lignarius TaxID=156445 RepID=A0A224Y4W9_9HEMI
MALQFYMISHLIMFLLYFQDNCFSFGLSMKGKYNNYSYLIRKIFHEWDFVKSEVFRFRPGKCFFFFFFL